MINPPNGFDSDQSCARFLSALGIGVPGGSVRARGVQSMGTRVATVRS